MRAIDGVRAIGVLLVILFHLSVTGFSAGFVGVDVFFVLSGFLITSLLLAEIGRTGGVKLTAFWARRARRLLPALAIVLVVVALVTMKIDTFSERTSMRGDLVSTTLYVANWHFIEASSYFNDIGVTSALQHTWSLGIEEQFYVLWPLLLLLLVPLLGKIRRSVAVPTLVGAMLSATFLAVLYVPGAADRAYMGTDARIFEPLLGGVAAMLVAGPRGRRLVERRGTAMAAVGTAGLVGLLFAIRPDTSFYYYGGAVLVSIATALIVAPLWVGRGGIVKRFLQWGPMAWIGLLSYGLYLWHFPFVVWLRIGQVDGVNGAIRMLIVVAGTFAAATASFYLVERPIRTARGWHLRWPEWNLSLGFLRKPLIALGLVPLVMVSVIQVSLASTKVPPPTRAQPVVMLVGDSVPERLTPVFEEIAQRRGWRIVSAAKGACSVTGELAWSPPPQNRPLHDARGCPDVPAEQNALLRADHPDVVVWWDRWSLSSFLGPDGTVVRAGSSRFWQLRKEHLDEAVKRFAAEGAYVLFIEVEPPGKVLESRCADWCPLWRQFLIAHYRDIAQPWNSILRLYATDHRDRATYLSVTDIVCNDDAVPCDDRLDGQPARFDGTHYTDAAAAIVVNAIVDATSPLLSTRA